MVMGLQLDVCSSPKQSSSCLDRVTGFIFNCRSSQPDPFHPSSATQLDTSRTAAKPVP
jgi:hypothetical protein